MELIDLHDDLGKSIRAYRKKIADGQEVTVETLLSAVGDMQLDIEDTLERHGVEAFEAEGEQFDPKLQSALKTVPCSDETQHRVIVERLRKGFRYEERILRPEAVSAYKFEKADQP